MTFPERLRQLREQKRPRRSATATAELLGLSKSTMRRYELGEHIPDLFIAAAIADYYGVSLDYLAGRTEEDRPV